MFSTYAGSEGVDNPFGETIAPVEKNNLGTVIEPERRDSAGDATVCR